MSAETIRNLLADAEKGSLPALAKLDGMGLIPGDDEDAGAFVRRIRVFLANLDKMEAELRNTGTFEKEGISLSGKQRIPKELFAEAGDTCRKLYGFAVDWVPGFFVNPSFGLLFGGCSFCFFPDFFAFFIIRENFRTRRQWLVYNRRELLAHELCHIARVALDSRTFEETFAYQTSLSRFRRLLGGIFLNQSDSFLFLGSVFLFLLARIVQTFLMPSFPGTAFILSPVLALLWLGGRYAHLMHVMNRARKNLETQFGNKANAVLFRCTDREIHEIAGLDASKLPAYLERQTSLKWRIVMQKG